MAHESQSASIHASVVRLMLGGVMLLGPSASGKSSLTLALIRQKNAALVADDRVHLQVDENQQLIASAPDSLAGLLEVRGMGLLRIGTDGQFERRTSVRLAVQLVARKDVPRLPTQVYLPPQNGLQHAPIPLLHLHAFDAQTPDIVTLALATIGQEGFAEDDIHAWPNDA